MHVPDKIVSGGQTGADLGGLVGACRCGIETGGICPRAYKTEVGEKPEELKKYGLIPHPSPNYKDRTLANIQNSDATIIFSPNAQSSGTKLTIGYCQRENKPFILVQDVKSGVTQEVIDFLDNHKPKILNIAGNRESVSPGLTKSVAAYVHDMFRNDARETSPG